MEIGDSSRHKHVLVRHSSLQCSMGAMMVEVCSEIEQLVFEICSGPEQRAVQVLTSNRADSAVPQRDGTGNVGDRFDLGHLQYPQIGLPLPKPKKGIVVGAEVLRHLALPSNGVVEHPAKS